MRGVGSGVDTVMAHSHDRTLLAQLGFSDKDKKNPRHDLACRYLSQKDVLPKLVKPHLVEGCDLVTATVVPEHHITKGDGRYKTTIGFADLYLTKMWVAKGTTGPARILCPAEVKPDNTISDFSRRYQDQRNREQANMAAWQEQWDQAPTTRFGLLGSMSMLVEVKIEPVSAGDILRQMRLYSEYMPTLGAVALGDTVPKAWATDTRYQRCQRSDCKCFSRSHDSVFPLATYHWLRHRSLVVTDFALSSDDVTALSSAGIGHTRLGRGFEDYATQQQSAGESSSPEI